jgi:hypothetical protein
MFSTPSPYPLRLTGELSPRLSRGLWLVKWLLAIPHFIVLFFLWIAFAVVSVVAFFAILFTGRYPRSLFEFNAGVLRWSWRVGFYSYSALVSCALSSLLKCGILWHGENWTSQAGVGVD